MNIVFDKRIPIFMQHVNNQCFRNCSIVNKTGGFVGLKMKIYERKKGRPAGRPHTQADA